MKRTVGDGSTGPSLQSIVDDVSCILFWQNMQCRGPVPDRHNGYYTSTRYKFDMWNGTNHKMLFDPIGFYIPDNKYHPITEGMGFYEDIKLYPNHFPEWMHKAMKDKRCRKIDLLLQLQGAHDNPAFWTKDHTAGNALRMELKRIAKTHRLKVGVINKLEPGKSNYDLLAMEKKTSQGKKGKRAKHR